MKLSGKLPEGDMNGLSSIEKDMLEAPKKPRIALMVIDGDKISTNVSTGARELTARIRHVDVLAPGDMPLVEQLLRRAAEHRTGQAMLPIQMEDEIDRILALALADGEEPERVATTDLNEPAPNDAGPQESGEEPPRTEFSDDWDDKGDEPEPEA